MEQIVRRRAHPNVSHVSEIIQSNNESKQREQESETVKNLKKELLDKQYIIIDLKNQLVELKVRSERERFIRVYTFVWGDNVDYKFYFHRQSMIKVYSTCKARL